MTNEAPTRRTPARPRGWWSAALLALASGTSGCADHVQSTVVACPCNQGVCCDSGVCAADQNACEQATAALSSDSAGHWTGYVENFTFPSGSDALDLTLQLQPDGSLSGHITLGQGAVPPPPTDSTLAWPAGVDFFDTGAGLLGLDVGPLEGVSYAIKNVTWTALRLRFEIDTDEPWGPWCRLQTSYAYQTITEPSGSVNTFWLCVPPNSGYNGGCGVYDPVSMQTTPIDCNRMALCESWTCDCTATGCDSTTRFGLLYDIALRNNEGDGSVRNRQLDPGGKTPQANNMRLIRASN